MERITKKEIVRRGFRDARDARRLGLGSLSRKQPKIFCIGRNKTGTTSVEKALKDLAFRVAPQRPAELLFEEWRRKDFAKLLLFCRFYDAFQDAPFSFPFTYVALDQAFPNAKFILTVRDSADEWYESNIRFQSKLFGNGNLPTEQDLKAATYVYKGLVWDTKVALYGEAVSDRLYDPQICKDHYERYNANVIEYFRGRENKLLILNVKDEGAYQRLAAFLGKSVPKDADFPWENKT